MKPTLPLLPLLLLLSAGPACQSAPVSSQALVPEQPLQLLDEIEDACMSFLSAEARPQDVDTLGQLCYMAMRAVQHSQDFTGRGDAKRAPVLHPLLQLVPQLHTRRLRRITFGENLHGPGGIQSRGYFLYRPRNGRRSVTLV
ncbi:neuromedin-U isoform X2 [Brienomyrus brachyistius]|uniref:neuromedin-U isoform X2 n=1 Tax=Brienomyrus brachyistius TaxID=42636 RepID=UPI0020B28413|nr:neuromedin-U isoform X2 [Brienomyrus brachyistius]